MRKHRKHIPYTKEEEQFILDNYGVMKTTDIAKKLGRPYDSIVAKHSNLQLAKRQGNKTVGPVKPDVVESYKNKYTLNKLYFIEVGDRKASATENYNKDYQVDFTAKLIGKTAHFLIFDRGHCKECIKFTDIARQAYRIEALEGV